MGTQTDKLTDAELRDIKQLALMLYSEQAKQRHESADQFNLRCIAEATLVIWFKRQSRAVE